MAINIKTVKRTQLADYGLQLRRGLFMKKIILTLAIIIAGSVSLFGFDIVVPDEIPDYQNLEVSLVMNDDEGVIDEARFYLVKGEDEEPVYAKFIQKDGVWSATIPYTYLTGEELRYFAQIRTADQRILKNPETGEKRTVPIKDEKAPLLTLLVLEKMELVGGVEQFVSFQIEDESVIKDFTVLYKGEPINKAAVFEGTLSFMITPDEGSKEASIDITLTDRSDNILNETFVFAVAKKREPFFAASSDYTAGIDIEYAMNFGDTVNTVDLGEIFSDFAHELTASYELSGETELKAGPIKLNVSAGLVDSMYVQSSADFQTVGDDIINPILADYQNIMHLWHPWNFDNEFDYTGDVAREYESDNHFYAKLSLFENLLTYTFGDQDISFQNQTIDKLKFRGSAVSLDLALINLSVGKGLTDLGMKGSAWPQNFFGVKVGIDIFDYWWLQTNISLLSSFQGQYNTIVSSGISPVGTLYDLDPAVIKPEENLVIGVSTGSINKWFTLDAGVGVTLYTDDASSILDLDGLKDQILSLTTTMGSPFDMSAYITPIQTYHDTIFPYLDYFPISTGLISVDMLGLTYGADLTIPALNLKGWLHKTDSTYKSIGASVSTGVFNWGASWEMKLADFPLSTAFNWTQDNIPNILFDEILPLVDELLPLVDLPDLASGYPEEADISNVSYVADIGVGTPSIDIIGSLSLGYTFEWLTTNTVALAEKLTDSVDKVTLLASSKNDTTMVNTVDLRWKSGKIKLGNFKASLNAKTKDSLSILQLVDNAADGTQLWDLSYGVGTSLQYDILKLDFAFEHAWSLDPAEDVTYGYDLKFSISKLFFDSISLKGSFDQVYNSADLQTYEIGGSLSVEKRFGLFSIGSVLNGEYSGDAITPANDALALGLTISGGISL